MPGTVLDASGALALLAPSQSTTASRSFSAQLPVDMTAPAVFRFEVRHAVLKLERRSLSPVGLIDAALTALEAGISFEPEPDAAGFAALLPLARAEGLSIYDATYFDLALRAGATIASRDGPLLDAARRRGVHVIDLR